MLVAGSIKHGRSLQGPDSLASWPGKKFAAKLKNKLETKDVLCIARAAS
jgi:hypothetical protein